MRVQFFMFSLFLSLTHTHTFFFFQRALQDQFYCLLRRRDAATILVLGYIFSSIAAFLPKHLVITAAEMFKKGSCSS